MKLDALYRGAVAIGMSRDPRGRDEVGKILAEEGTKFKKLEGDDLEAYDRDRLFNPYADTRILFGDPDI